MGTVLLLVYLAGVADELKFAAGVAVIVCVVGAAITGIVSAITLAIDPSDNEKAGIAAVWKWWAKKATPWLAAVWLVGALVPSKQLLYIAAGIRAGEEAAKTEIAQKALHLLDKKLDELLGEGDKK